ncbi:hypothetical protein NPX13_g6460 [Xylaria arbuscula]|uniref:Protein kinase domain-containing protein n=1 Tax=Xylaria arbuscula TaxID=114810 RepID=A0A9W8NC58_9PEZI|nr:hypothetical protein NPX13_g6460 [Xylaria arbuscula]
MADLALGIAGLAVGVPGIVQVTLSIGDAIRRRLVHYEDDFKNLLDTVIRINKSQSNDMLIYFFSEDQTTPQELRDELIEMFQVLRGIFERLLLMFPEAKVGEKTKITPALKARGKEMIEQLEEWNDRFFKRALVFVMFGRKRLPKSVDENQEDDEYGVIALRKVERLRDAIHKVLEGTNRSTQSLINQPNAIDETRTPLAHSSMQLCTRRISQETYLVEYRTYSDDAYEHEILNHLDVVREIASILRNADARLMGILHCDGFLWEKRSNRFELCFPFPAGLEKPRTLLDILMNPETRRTGVKHPLNQRFSLAKRIVHAVFVLHAAGFVHKQIRPDNVLIFDHTAPNTSSTEEERKQYPYSLGEPFLIGFDSARKVDATSLMLPEKEWQKSLYLSPERHRLQHGDEFQMHHDIFSLGLGKRVWRDGGANLRSPGELKSAYLALAKGAVPRLMGQKYADVITACLTGLEGRTGDIKDEDGIVVGTRYVMAIIKKLEEISI